MRHTHPSESALPSPEEPQTPSEPRCALGLAWLVLGVRPSASSQLSRVPRALTHEPAPDSIPEQEPCWAHESSCRGRTPSNSPASQDMGTFDGSSRRRISHPVSTCGRRRPRADAVTVAHAGRGWEGPPAQPFAAPTLNSHSLAVDATVSKREEGER